LKESPILKGNCSGEYWTMNKKFDPVILINEEDISCKVVKFVKIMI
jgi:hypothetical protein